MISSCSCEALDAEENDNFANAMSLVLSTPPPQRRFVQLRTHGRPPSIEVLAPAANSPLREAPLWGCVFTMLSTMIGGGALSLPYALKLSGLAVGIPLLLLSALASDFALYALCSASRRTGTSTLAELARAAQGPRLEGAVVAALFALCAFVSVAYTRLLRDLLALFLAPFGDAGDSVDFFLVAAALLVLFPLSLNKELHSLRYAAFTSFGGAICVAALFVCRATPMVREDPSIVRKVVEPTDPLSALNALPIMVLLFLCQFNVLSIHARLHNPTRPRLKRLIHVAVGVSFLFYIFFGIAGAVVCESATFEVAQDALSCLSPTPRTIADDDDDDASKSSSDALLACAGGAFAVSILLNTPALIIPLRDCLHLLAGKVFNDGKGLLRRDSIHPSSTKLDERSSLAGINEETDEESQGEEDSSRRRPIPTTTSCLADYYCTPATLVHFFLTAGIIVVVVLGAQNVPGVASVWAVAGSSVGLFVAFMLPCMLYLLVRGDKEGGPAKVRQGICAFLVAGSLALAVACTYRNAKSIFFP